MVTNRSFAQDDDEQADGGSTPGEPEYTFEGFKVEFSQKVMLTPPASPRKK
jgi:hypothetical protein